MNTTDSKHSNADPHPDFQEPPTAYTSVPTGSDDGGNTSSSLIKTRGETLIQFLLNGQGIPLARSAQALRCIKLDFAEPYSRGLIQAGPVGRAAISLAAAIAFLDGYVSTANRLLSILRSLDEQTSFNNTED